ncbi:uncharacterized protein LOC115081014 [Rhinatrema bivittatum]|uniref:uncharacterized protein LOC115081014 n=1 Tax=Rhinatrema bivittatum TaxID=194408 RepID=UPI0011269CFA|nr:uncharacterized protein LOC115081014 [Rhinatrema bivittatum]
MALPRPLALLLLLLGSAYSAPPGCEDFPESNPVNLTQALGKWHLVAGAYRTAESLAQDKQISFAGIKISEENDVINFTYSITMLRSVYFRERDNLQVSEGPDGLTFKAQGDSVLTVKRKVSEDCLAMTVPEGSADVGIVLACKSHRAPKSVVDDFTSYAACQNYLFTNVRDNATRFALICEEILQKDPLGETSKILGRWTLAAKASSSPRSPAEDENHVDGWLEFAAPGGEEVTVTRSPDAMDVDEIKEGKYIIKEQQLHLETTDTESVILTVYRTCPDELVLLAHRSAPGSSSSSLFLLTKSGMVQPFEKEKFKNQALCSLLPHVYGIPAEQHKHPNASTCNKILRRDPPKEISEVSGRWTLVAKASSYKRCPCMRQDEVDGWLEFTLQGDEKVTVTRSPDSVDMEEVPDREYFIMLNGFHLPKELVALTVFKTCPDDLLLLYVTKLLKTPIRTTLMLLSKSGTAPAYIMEKFKARARCEKLANVYGIPDDQ